MDIINQLLLDENNVVFNPMMGNSYQLNNISKEIILLLKEAKTKEEIITILSEKYNVSKKVIFIDLSDFFCKLKVYGLIA